MKIRSLSDEYKTRFLNKPEDERLSFIDAALELALDMDEVEPSSRYKDGMVVVMVKLHCDDGDCAAIADAVKSKMSILGFRMNEGLEWTVLNLNLIDATATREVVISNALPVTEQPTSQETRL